MQKQTKWSQSIKVAAISTTVVLLIPLIAMQLSSEVNWSTFDFLIMGVLVFGTVFSYKLIMHYASKSIYRIATIAAIGITFLLIWVNLAVGLIGSGPNLANLMYIAVVVVVFTGSIVSRFSERGMSYTMYAAAFALVLHTLVTLMLGVQNNPGSSVLEVLLVNGFFAMLYALTGSFYNFAMKSATTQ